MIEIACAFTMLLSYFFAIFAFSVLGGNGPNYRPEVPITMGIIAIAFALIGLTIVIATKGLK